MKTRVITNDIKESLVKHYTATGMNLKELGSLFGVSEYSAGRIISKAITKGLKDKGHELLEKIELSAEENEINQI